MFLSRVSLKQFRNYEDAGFTFGPGINLLYGSNGAGKTNLLDAIHYLSVTRSYFNAQDQQQVQLGTSYFAIEGTLQDNLLLSTIRLVYQRAQGKTLLVNHNEVDKFSSHLGTLPVVMIAPGDIALIQEGSELRRKMLDILLSQHDAVYLHELTLYNRILDQRNKLLRNFQETLTFNRELLEVYNQKLIQSAAIIYRERSGFLQSFLPVFLEKYKTLCQDAEMPGIAYSSDFAGGNFEQLLQQQEQTDLELMRTTRGIHRDDLVFTLMDQPLKKFGSQGQQKSFVLSLKLAQYEYLSLRKGFKPLLLLDDIFEKLDQQRLHALFGWLAAGAFGQVFITDTQQERALALLKNATVPVNVFEISGGRVQSA